MREHPPFFPRGDEDDDDDLAWQSALNRLGHQPTEPDEGESPRYRPGKGDLV